MKWAQRQDGRVAENSQGSGDGGGGRWVLGRRDVGDEEDGLLWAHSVAQLEAEMKLAAGSSSSDSSLSPSSMSSSSSSRLMDRPRLAVRHTASFNGEAMRVPLVPNINEHLFEPIQEQTTSSLRPMRQVEMVPDHEDKETILALAMVSQLYIANVLI
jgi:hypothetical protein